MSPAPETKERYCTNCHYPLSPHGNYCPHCSQKYGDGRITVWELVKEYAESFLNFDSKIFLTIGHLFQPGKLTNEFFLGHHKRYVSPLRIFVIMAILHFAVLGYIGIEDLEIGITQLTERATSTSHQGQLMKEFEQAREKVEKKFPQENVKIAMDSLFVQIDDPRNDSFPSSYPIQTDTGLIFKSLAIPNAQFQRAPLDSLANVYDVKGFVPRLFFMQQIKILRNGGSFAQYIFGKMLWMVLLMMPALSLILKLLYIRRKKYFVEHLIFSFHYHAFAFFMVSLAFIVVNALSNNQDDEIWATFGGGATVLVLAYLYLAMLKVYKQGIIKTFIKFSMLCFSYIFVFITCFSLIILISAILF